MVLVVPVDDQGRITLPPEARAALHLGGEAQLECEIADGSVVLRPAMPPDDAWAYTPAHRAAVQRALADLAAGRVYRLSEDDLLQIVARAEAAEREGREYHPSHEELKAMESKHLATER